MKPKSGTPTAEAVNMLQPAPMHAKNSNIMLRDINCGGPEKSNFEFRITPSKGAIMHVIASEKFPRLASLARSEERSRVPVATMRLTIVPSVASVIPFTFIVF